MGEACLEMEDEAPDKVENSRRVAIDNTRSIDGLVFQLHLQEDGAPKWRHKNGSQPCLDHQTLTCLSARKVRTLEMFFSLKIR